MKNSHVILISGKKQSGKNTLGDMLAHSLNHTHKMSVEIGAFADELKAYCTRGFPDVFNYLNDPILGKIEDYLVQHGIVPDDDARKWLRGLRCPDGCFGDEKTAMSRLLLQNVGTDLFRNQISEDYWVNIMIDKVRKSPAEYYIITDCRFPNEIEAFVDAGFSVHTIRIIDAGFSRIPNRDANDLHSSENSLNFECKYNVENNGTIDDLRKRANEIAAFIVPLNIPREPYADDFEKFKKKNAGLIEKARKEGEDIHNASLTITKLRDELIETCKNSNFENNSHTLDAFKTVIDYLEAINY